MFMLDASHNSTVLPCTCSACSVCLWPSLLPQGGDARLTASACHGRAELVAKRVGLS